MDSTVREGWAEWAIGMGWILLRIYARIQTVGWRWQGDDYLVLLAGACYTGVFVTTVIQRPWGSNIGFTDEQRAAFTPEQIKPLEEGAKAILAALFVYATGLWAIKGQVLFLYYRLTTNLVLFCIPAPIILKASILWTRKLLILCLPYSGLFVFVVSIVRLVLTLGDIKHTDTLAIWAIREMFVAVLCVNAPCIKPLVSQTRWLKTTGNSDENDYTPHSGRGHMALKNVPKDLYPITNFSARGSFERNMPSASTSADGKPGSSDGPKMEIQRTTDVEVRSWSPIDRVERGKGW